MRTTRKMMLTGLTAMAAGAGYMAGKKRNENKNSYHKLLHKIEEMLD
jgi:LPXTG-motif cell wall-anchored protein